MRPARLTVRRQGSKGERVVHLTGPLRVGRGADNDLVLAHSEVSRYHCRIEPTDTGWELVDLGSRNSTWVNGRRVVRKALMHGESVQVGPFVLIFTAGDGEGTSSDTAAGKTAVGLREPETRFEVALEGGAGAWEKLVEVNRALVSELNLKRLLHLVMAKVLDVVGAERAFLLLKEKGRLVTLVSRDLDGEPIHKADLKVSRNIAGTVMRTERPVLAHDAQEDERFRDFLSVHGLKLRSLMCVPLKLSGETIGVLYVDNRWERGAFDEEDLRILESFADQAAIAVRNARLFEENEARRRQIQTAMRKAEELNRKLQEVLASKERDLQDARRIIEERATRFRYDYSGILTRSPKMQAVFATLDRIIDSDVPVLVQGESGTGKELVARAVHENSSRRDKAFVAVNCSAIPGELLESEFFGYVRGAFTGAERDKPGLFEQADGGTLFLDEIGDMPPALQAKLLRVLEEKKVRRLGSEKECAVDVRIVSASNQDLVRLVAEGAFREDLLFRLNVVTVTLPPLRERPEDVPLLVAHFLKEIATRNETAEKRVSEEAMRVLERYSWPGNVRELRNEIERAFAMSDDAIDVEHLSPAFVERAMRSADLEGAELSARVLARKLRPLSEIRDEAVGVVERAAIEVALEACGWNKSKTARALAISRPTLDSKIKQYGIERPRQGERRGGAANGRTGR